MIVFVIIPQLWGRVVVIVFLSTGRRKICQRVRSYHHSVKRMNSGLPIGQYRKKSVTGMRAVLTQITVSHVVVFILGLKHEHI